MANKFYITGIRRGLGKALHDFYSPNVVKNMKECDIFINCKHDQFDQVNQLHLAIHRGKRVINIGSLAMQPRRRLFVTQVMLSLITVKIHVLLTLVT